jgi:uncharacterized protein (UPF0276 family)
MAAAGFRPPRLGIGLVYFQELHPVYEQLDDLIDVVEVEPQTLWHRGPAGGPHRIDPAAYAPLARLRQPKLLHGVGMPLVSPVPPDPRQIPAWQASIAALSPAWVSEHLAFMRARPPDPPEHREASGLRPASSPGDTHHAGFLLPPRQDAATARAAARQIRRLQDLSGVPVAFEIAPNYLRPQPDEIPDGQFYAEVARQADCGILVDLHNLWCNERNGRGRVEDVLATLPPEQVWEFHVAGGQLHGAYWLDAHMGSAPRQVLDIAARWISRFPHLGAIVFEVMPTAWLTDQFDVTRLRDQLTQLQALWQRHAPPAWPRTPRQQPQPQRPAPPVADDTADLWYGQLAALVNRRPCPTTDLNQALALDPGVQVYRDLIDSARGSVIASELTLSWRLMMLTLGQATTDALLQEFWRNVWPQPFALDEISAFAQQVDRWQEEGRLPVPHLRSVIDYEMAHARLHSPDGTDLTEIQVTFDVDPAGLLNALAQGQLPPAMPTPQTRGQHMIVVRRTGTLGQPTMR